MKDKNPFSDPEIVLGFLVVFGIPLVAWTYFDWRAALLAFVLGLMVVKISQLT